MTTDIRVIIQNAVEGRHLGQDEAAFAMTQIMGGKATPAQIGAFAVALRMKGETPEEIAGMARVMREKSLHVDFDGKTVDTCGTGGDRQHTFNISTTAAFVAAGAGAVVAKHGNRSMSGSSGSVDALEKLGVKIDLGPEGVRRCLEEVGIGFMFAQAFHPAMKHAAGPRREIGVRTIFNLLGPLTNPAGASCQVIGTGDAEAAEKFASALALLGTEHALVVHGEDGSDEISVEGLTRVWQVTGSEIKRRRTRPSDFGLPDGSRAHIVAGDVDRSVEMVLGVLDGNGGGHNAAPGIERSARTVAVINAAAALVAAGRASSFQEGANLAMESIDSGEARRKLDQLVSLGQELA